MDCFTYACNDVESKKVRIKVNATNPTNYHNLTTHDQPVIPDSIGNLIANNINPCYNITMKKSCAVYILTNSTNKVLYIGVTSNLYERITQHKSKAIEGFTKKYKVTKLIYYEIIPDITTAIKREKQLKKWNRSWKIELINKINPEWNELSIEI